MLVAQKTAGENRQIPNSGKHHERTCEQDEKCREFASCAIIFRQLHHKD